MRSLGVIIERIPQFQLPSIHTLASYNGSDESTLSVQLSDLN